MRQEILAVNKNAKKEYINKLLISIVVRISYLIIPFFYSYAVEEITNNNIQRAILLVGFLLFFTLIYYFSIIINDYFYEKLYQKIYNGLTRVCLQYTQKNSIYSLSRISLGEYNSIMTDDINVIADYCGNIPMTLARLIDFILSLNFYQFIW